MKLLQFLILVGPLLMSAGCSLVARTVGNAAYEFVFFKENHALDRLARGRADAAWDEFCRANPGQNYDPDYAAGFKDGFAASIEAGGQSPAPSLPPPACPLNYHNPQGCQAVSSWYAGYHNGAAMAAGRTGGDPQSSAP
jgi:hypothetical protein